MPAPTIRFPTGLPVPSTFAADGFCDPGSFIRGWLSPIGLPGLAMLTSNTSWVLHFMNVPAGNYILEVEADNNPLFRDTENVPVQALVPLPPPPLPPFPQPAPHAELPADIDIRRPQRVRLAGRTANGKAKPGKSKVAAGKLKAGKVKAGKVSVGKANAGKTRPSQAKAGKAKVRLVKTTVKSTGKAGKVKKQPR